jgi:hypothetical protein
MQLRLSTTLALGLLGGASSSSSATTCPGSIDVSIDGAATPFAIVRNNHSAPGGTFFYSSPVDVDEAANVVSPGMYDAVLDGKRNGGRAYLATSCEDGAYDHAEYAALPLLDKTFSYTVDLSAAGCGCNAALYLVSMAQNTEPSTCDDYYCDANAVCGVRCSEIDIQEGNAYSWHTTAHVAADGDGVGGGYGGGGDGWSGPRDFTAAEYSPGGSLIDTSRPFGVNTSFPTSSGGDLAAIKTTLAQDGRAIDMSIDAYSYSGANGFDALTASLAAGMTPVVSYWCSTDMLWMDGTGQDGLGPCAVDTPADCGDSVTFSAMSISA